MDYKGGAKVGTAGTHQTMLCKAAIVATDSSEEVGEVATTLLRGLRNSLPCSPRLCP